MSAIIAQYFLNHRLDHSEIEWQMAEFAHAGYHGVFPHARQGLLTPYFSEDWWRAMDKILALSRRNKTEFWIWDEDYFPSGLAGGRVVWNDPAAMQRSLEFALSEVSGAGPFEVDFEPVGMLLRTYAVEKLPDGGYAPPIDITKYCGTRRQRWSGRYIKHDAYSPDIDPLGHPHWRCSMEDNHFALSWTPSHPGQYIIAAGIVCTSHDVRPNILRRQTIADFIKLSYEPYYQRYADQFGKTIKGALTDEPSPGFWLYPWSDEFADEFQRDHHYDLIENLPHLALDIDDTSAAVRHHYRLTQHRLQVETYTGQIAHWCRDHNIKFVGHLTRTEWLSLVAFAWPNELRCYQPMDIPCADPLGATSAWPDAAAYHTGLKVVSSAAHLFGRDQAGTDCLAVMGDETRIRDLKFILDYQMSLGINYFAFHGLSYSLQGPRKDEVPPSLFYQHTEFKHTKPFLDHVTRTTQALTAGRHLCEIAVLYPSTSLACQQLPEHGINKIADTPVERQLVFPRHHLPDETRIHALSEQLLSHQCDFDFIDEVTLQENVTDAPQLTTPEPYRTILLPYLRYIDERTAAALLRFAKAVGRVIAIGYMPKALPLDPAKGQYDWHDDTITYLDTLDDDTLAQLPAVDVTGPGARDVFVLRRQTDQTTHTFIFNRNEQPFIGQIAAHDVYIAPRSSEMLTENPDGQTSPSPHRQLYDRRQTAAPTDLSAGWTVTFEPNHIPLSFWHLGNTPAQGPAYDLMNRQPDPAPAGADEISYNCRFMLTGAIPDARIVIEDQGIQGDWRLYVNDTLIDSWQPARVSDCCNLEASVAAALRCGSNPTLNVVTITTSGPNRSLNEIPYLYGRFTCQYRYQHPSYPFLQGPASPTKIDVLADWSTLGHPTFSGSAVYQRQFTIDKPGDYLLDLGRVEDIATVTLDNLQIQVLPWPPYWCCLKALTAGPHDLQIEVTNAPANRNRNAHQPAGLLGPIKLFP